MKFIVGFLVALLILVAFSISVKAFFPEQYADPGFWRFLTGMWFGAWFFSAFLRDDRGK